MVSSQSNPVIVWCKILSASNNLTLGWSIFQLSFNSSTLRVRVWRLRLLLLTLQEQSSLFLGNLSKFKMCSQKQQKQKQINDLPCQKKKINAKIEGVEKMTSQLLYFSCALYSFLSFPFYTIPDTCKTFYVFLF